MNYKNGVLILCLIICVLFSISSVVAFDTNDNITADDLTTDYEPQLIKQIENDEIISVDDGTFKALQDKINNATEGSTITLENDYSGDLIKISNPLTIEGLGHAISGKFEISANNVILKNITFINNAGSDFGGAIYLGGSDNIVSDCRFVNNSATYGGAIYWDGANGVVSGCSFEDNSAELIVGAIYWDGADGIISECSFVNNSANDMCGVIYGANVVNCTFINNFASRYGAICSCSIADCSFVNNSADYGGSVGLSDVVNCTFISNFAQCCGAVCDSNAVNCTFINNFANDDSGAIYQCSAENCTFISNHADANGGAMCYGFAVNCTFITNSANGQGGAIYNSATVNCRFISNSAGNNGGAIYLYNNGTAFGCSFVDNSAFYGGAVYMYAENGTVSNCSFVNNSGEYFGGAIYWYGNNGTVSNCSFVNNIAQYNGGAIYWNGNNGTIFKCKSYNEYAEGYNDIYLAGNNITLIDNKENSAISLLVTQNKGVTTLTASLTPTNANGSVVFTINDMEWTVEIESGNAILVLSDLEAGNYTATASYNGNSELKASTSNTVTFSIADKENSTINLLVTQNKRVTTLTASLTPTNANGSVVFTINDMEWTVEIESGNAILVLSDLEAGNYTATASYNGNSELKASTSNTVTFSIADAYHVLTANPVTKIYGTSAKLVVNLADNEGNYIENADVNVVIGSVTKTIKTNAEGKATMDITNAPGTYTAKITYTDANTTAKITVKKATPKLTAAKKTFKKSVKTKKYTVTLKNNNNKVMKNKYITLKVNKKTYKVKTNSKGQATFKITNLNKKGTFTAVVKYAGDSYYNAKTVKPKIIVK